MKSKNVKILSAIFVIFLFFVGGIFYFASTKLQPDEIKKMTIAETQKVFPKAEVLLENVEIGWGLNFNINLKKFSIKAVKDNEKIEMMSVDQLVVKVPLWAILTGSGVVEVKLDAPLMNYHEFKEGNNWTYAMGDKKAEDANKTEASSASGDASAASALGIFGKSKINVKLSDVSVKYILRDSSNGQIKVSRFLVKGLNFESSTAFEIASNANFVMKDQSNISFDTIAIGEFNIADMIKDGSISSVVIVKVNNITKSGLNWKFPEITTNIDFVLKKDGEVKGKLTTTFESQNKITANFKMTKEMEISDINAEIILKDVAAMMGLEKMVDMSKAKLSLKGNVLYSEDKKINATIGFAIAPGIIYSQEGVTASTTVNGDFKGSDLSVKVKTEMLEGSINTLVNGQFNPNEKFDMAKLKPFDIKVVASGMRVPEKFIRAKLWDKKPETVSTTAEESKAPVDSKSKDPSKTTAVTEAGKNAPPMGLPPSSVNVEWSNLNIGGEDFSGRGKIITSLKSIAIDNMNFKFSKGTGKLTQTMFLEKNSSESKFNFEMTNLNLSSFKAFLPPMIENFSGTFTGKVNGSATMFKNGKAPGYDVNVIADAKKGEIKKLNISDYINPILASIPVVKDQVKEKQFKFDGNFETLTMKGHFTNSQYSISSFDFVGLDKKIQVTGSGEIYPVVSSGKMSTMEVNFTDNTGKISDVLVKNVGTKILPLRLSGPGFELKPDTSFTISKLAKGAFKTKGEEKVKEVLQKNIDKIVPAEAKEKVKGLLDGFFKKR